MHALIPTFALIAAFLLMGGCGASPERPEIDSRVSPAPGQPEVRITTHRDGDDLLSGGLGLDGLRNPQPPAVANAEAPTSAELRRRALWTNWRGIADLDPAGGFAASWGGVPPTPGREFHALLRLDGAHNPHRVMVQLPDAFDARRRCLLVTASSGSRGIYGAIALASAWGLPRGCAVVHTDKGGGTDLFDASSGEGFGLDGRLTADPDAMAFSSSTKAPWVAYKHAHSADHPEADWGRHLQQAAAFALRQLDAAMPAQAPFTFANTRVIAVGLSNAGGAVLQAAGMDDDWLDGVVAVAPNVLPGEGGRALYDYASEAALWMSCAQVALSDAPMQLPESAIAAQRALACQALVDAALVPDAARAPAIALQRLRDGGWTDAALRAGMLSTAFDLWRGVGVAYSSSYSRSAPDAMPCGYAFAAVDATGLPRAASRAERALWWSDGAGIAPGAGVQIVTRDTDLSPFARLRCLRALWTDDEPAAQVLRTGVEATRVGLPRAGLPLLVIHGVDDGLIPEAFSSAPYVLWVRATGQRPLAYWRVHRAQHFDAFLALPALRPRYGALLKFAYDGLEAMSAHLDSRAPLVDAELDALSR